jgi:hypothetical protein
MNNNKDTSKATILVIAMGFLIIHLVFSLKWAVYVALGVGLVGIISDEGSKKIEWIWSKLSFVLSKIIPNILLASLFYLVLFPLSMLSKLFIKDPLLLKNKYDSLFIDVKPSSIKESMEKIW